MFEYLEHKLQMLVVCWKLAITLRMQRYRYTVVAFTDTRHWEGVFFVFMS